MKDNVTYQKDVAKKFDIPFFLTSHKLQLGFWPSITYTMTNASMFDVVQENTTPKDDSRDPLCGISHDKPKESYNPYIDVILGDFVLANPLDTNIFHVWMSQSLTIVQLDRNDSQNENFQIQYQKPNNGKRKFQTSKVTEEVGMVNRSVICLSRQ